MLQNKAFNWIHRFLYNIVDHFKCYGLVGYLPDCRKAGENIISSRTRPSSTHHASTTTRSIDHVIPLRARAKRDCTMGRSGACTKPTGRNILYKKKYWDKNYHFDRRCGASLGSFFSTLGRKSEKKNLPKIVSNGPKNQTGHRQTSKGD